MNRNYKRSSEHESLNPTLRWFNYSADIMQKSFEHWLVRILFNNFKEMSDLLYTEKNVRIWGPVSVFIFLFLTSIYKLTHVMRTVSLNK